jgi:thioesterase domain-containing protein
VDRAALPAPDYRASSGYTAPRTPTEETLAAIWAQALGVARVGVHDDFFALGGHSLLGVRVFAEMDKAFGKRLPLATLYRGATVEQLAKLLDQTSQRAPRTSLVPIQPLGTKPPLLFLPTMADETIYSRGIAQHLGADQPAFGIQMSNSVGERQPFARLEEIAACYAEDLCAHYPTGPFHLAGYSFGGILAYETGRQLAEQGRVVKLIAVIDTGPSGHRDLTITDACKSFVAILLNLPAWVVNNVLKSQPKGRLRTLKAHLRKIWDRGRRVLTSQGRELWKPDLADLFDVDLLPEEYRAMMEANLRAMREYVPRPYPGRLTLIRASVRPLLHSLQRDLGWSEWARGGVDVKSVPGHHWSILQEPNIQDLAHQLRAAVEQAESSIA